MTSPPSLGPPARRPTPPLPIVDRRWAARCENRARRTPDSDTCAPTADHRPIGRAMTPAGRLTEPASDAGNYGVGPPSRRAAPLAALIALLLLTACSSASSTSSAPAAGSTNQNAEPGNLPVAHPTVWLCRPGMANNPCEGGLDATDVGTGNGHTVQKFQPATDPKIDCFYVYPTLSEAKSTNAPLEPEPAAIGVARSQAARFASVCRLFVPVYRQLTLASIVNGSYGNAQAQALAAGDVDSAWHDYLNHDNQGRGVVLIGHS